MTTEFAEAGDDACETITAAFMKRQFEGEESRCVTIYQAEADDQPKVAVGKVTVAGRGATAAATIGGEEGSAKLVKAAAVRGRSTATRRTRTTRRSSRSCAARPTRS